MPYVGAVTERVQEAYQDKNSSMMLLFPGLCTIIILCGFFWTLWWLVELSSSFAAIIDVSYHCKKSYIYYKALSPIHWMSHLLLLLLLQKKKSCGNQNSYLRWSHYGGLGGSTLVWWLSCKYTSSFTRFFEFWCLIFAT
jgi:hypothetical protein